MDEIRKRRWMYQPLLSSSAASKEYSSPHLPGQKQSLHLLPGNAHRSKEKRWKMGEVIKAQRPRPEHEAKIKNTN